MIKAIILLSPVYVSLFWSMFFFLSKKSQNNARQILGVFMFFSFILFISHAIFFYKYYFVYVYFESLYVYARLALYPLFYTYILILSTIEYNRRRQFLHFIPSIIWGILLFVLTLFLSPDERILYIKTVLLNKESLKLDLTSLIGVKGLVFMSSRIVFVVQSITYLSIGIRIANRHNKLINNYFSDTEDRKLRWIKIIGIIGLVVSVVAVLFTFIGKSYFLHNEMMLIIPSFFFTAVYFIVGYQGHKQRLITIKLHNEESTETNLVNESNKSDIDIELKTKLLLLFENENIVVQQDLRINTVAEMLNTNRTYISRLINDEFGMNFNEFVNRHRIKDAKKLILSDDNKRYTLDYIAKKSGFGSVASFLRVFKEIEGTTPGKFRKASEQMY